MFSRRQAAPKAPPPPAPAPEPTPEAQVLCSEERSEAADEAAMERFDDDLLELKARLAQMTESMDLEVNRMHRAPLDATLASLGQDVNAPPPAPSRVAAAHGGGQVAAWLRQSLYRLRSLPIVRSLAGRAPMVGSDSKGHGGKPPPAKRRRVNILAVTLAAIVLATTARAANVVHGYDMSYGNGKVAEPSAPVASGLAGQQLMAPAPAAPTAATKRAAANATVGSTKDGGSAAAGRAKPVASSRAPPSPPTAKSKSSGATSPPAAPASAKSAPTLAASSNAFADPQNAEAATARVAKQGGKVEWLVEPDGPKGGGGSDVATPIPTAAKLAGAAEGAVPVQTPAPGKVCAAVSKFDFEVEACDGGCNEEASKFHCKMCKCKLCDFCVHPKPAAAKGNATRSRPTTVASSTPAKGSGRGAPSARPMARGAGGKGRGGAAGRGGGGARK